MANVTQTAKYAPEHVPASAYTFDANPDVGQFRVHNGTFTSFDVVERSLTYHQGLLREAEANVRHLENILKESNLQFSLVEHTPSRAVAEHHIT